MYYRGADGPTAILCHFPSGTPIFSALLLLQAYSYMALVPDHQPPIMKALTTKRKTNRYAAAQAGFLKQSASYFLIVVIYFNRPSFALSHSPAGDAYVRESPPGVRGNRAAEQDCSERSEQHRGHLFGPYRGGKGQRRIFFNSPDNSDYHPGADCLCSGNCRRSSDGENYVQTYGW